MKNWIWYTVAGLMFVDALGYTFVAIGPIRQALSPAEPYWQKRLLLNLMLANQGMYFAAIIALLGAVMKTHQQHGAFALLALTLATCIYTLITVPLITPSDSAHVIPRALAAALILIGFYLT